MAESGYSNCPNTISVRAYLHQMQLRGDPPWSGSCHPLIGDATPLPVDLVTCGFFSSDAIPEG
jgi:hypothetical protein